MRDSGHIKDRRISQGFSLLELLVAIIVLAILSTFTAPLITQMTQMQLSSERRLTLSDEAVALLQQIEMEVRNALPNSIRVSGTHLEYIPTVGGARYRAEADPNDPQTSGNRPVPCGGRTQAILSFAAADDCFEAIGTMLISDLTSLVDQWMVIANTSVNPLSQQNAYVGVNRARITQAELLADSGQNTGRHEIRYATDVSYIDTVGNTANQLLNRTFAVPSTFQRVYWVNQPVSWVCVQDAGTGDWRLLRLRNYGFHEELPSLTAMRAQAGTVEAVAHGHVNNCNFSAQQVENRRDGSLVITLSLHSTEDQAESLDLVHIVATENLP